MKASCSPLRCTLTPVHARGLANGFLPVLLTFHSMDLSPAWAAEIDRRLEASNNDTVISIPADQVLAELKAKYGD